MTTAKTDAREGALNFVTVGDQRTADRLRVPVGESVPWATAYPRPYWNDPAHWLAARPEEAK